MSIQDTYTLEESESYDWKRLSYQLSWRFLFTVCFILCRVLFQVDTLLLRDEAEHLNFVAYDISYDIYSNVRFGNLVPCATYSLIYKLLNSPQVLLKDNVNTYRLLSYRRYSDD